MADERLIAVIAGEPSGDVLGGKLIAALRRADPGLRFMGVGGERMAAEGVTSLFALSDIAVMGLAEVVPQLPRILLRLRQTARAIKAQHPAVVVTIDAPSFSFRVADRVRRLGIPVVHYVAPQLWAWRPGRARRLKGRTDRLLTLLPFEPEFFESVGVPTTYVGHPVIEDEKGEGARFRQHHALAAETPLLLVMPGSRVGVAKRMLPVMGQAVGYLARAIPSLRVVVPIVPGTARAVHEATSEWPGSPILVQSAAEKRDAFAAAGAAITVSGTSTLELAVAGVPMVVTYRVSRFSAMLARRMLKVSAVAMPNLIAGRAIVPELLQENCTPQRIAEQAALLLAHKATRETQRAALAEVVVALSGGGARPSDRAARAVLEAIKR